MEMKNYFNLIFMMVLLLVRVASNDLSETCGDIVPENPHYFIGERLVLTCAMWNVDYNKNVSLYFDTTLYKNGIWSYVEVNQTGYEIIQLNSTTIQLTSPVLTIDDARRHNKVRPYRCMVREVVNNCTEKNKKVVMKTYVEIPCNPKLLSYTDVPCPERQCRQVLVYWEPSCPSDLFGSQSDQQFEIIIKQRGSEKTWKSAVNDSDALSQPLILPDEGKVYEVMLRRINGSEKKQEDFSQLIIWPRNQSPIAPSMVVEYATMMNGTQLYITLSLTESQSQTSQIIYWYRGLQGIGCQEAKKVNGSSAEIFIENYVMDLNFKIGVESQQLQSGEITQSGIQIVSCIYRKYEKPLIPPKNFHIAKEIAEREGELSLQWDPYDCNSPDIESGYVLSYTLYYCQVTDESSCNVNYSKHDLNEILIERDFHSYTVRKLKPGGRYKVWLTARTSAGEGPPTDAIDTHIYLQDFPSWGKVMIGLASLIASLVMLTCFVKFQQYLMKRRNAFSVIEIPVPIGYMHLGHGHVIADDQSDEPFPDMDESEEPGNIITLKKDGDAQVSMTSDSSSSSRSSDLQPGDGPYIFINDMVCGVVEPNANTTEKEIKPFVLSSELGHQNANLLPEVYCRDVDNVDNISNSKTKPVLDEDMLDHTCFKLDGQASHLKSINSLLNHGSELQGLNLMLLDDCKGNICERDKDVHSDCGKDSSNLLQENVTTDKKIKPGWMKSHDDFELDELALSGDDLDAAASDDSLSLLADICRKLNTTKTNPDKTEKTLIYVPVDIVNGDVGQPLLSNSYFRYSVDTHLDEVSLRSNDAHLRSETTSMRSQGDYVRSTADEITHIDNVTCSIKCDDYIVITTDNIVGTLGEHERCEDNFENF